MPRPAVGCGRSTEMLQAPTRMDTAKPTADTRHWPGRAARGFITLLIGAAAIVFNQSAVHWRENSADDHLYAYCGWRILHGAVPYVGVWDNKPPGVWWLNTAAFAICGDGIGNDLLLGSLALAALLTAFVVAGRALYGPAVHWPALLTGAVLLTHLQFECGSNRTETFVAVAEAVGIASILLWHARGGRGWLLAAGIAAGAAPWFKQNGIACTAAILLFLCLRNPGNQTRFARLGWYCLGVALPNVAVMGVLATQGALVECYRAVIEFNRYFFVAGDATWIHLGRPIQLYWRELVAIWKIPALATAGALIGIIVFCRGATRRQIHAGVILLLLWIGLDFYLACVATGRLAYHLAPVLAPLGLLALQPLMALLGRTRLGECLLTSPLRTAACIAYGFLLYEAWLPSLAAARPCWYEKSHWYDLARKIPAPYEAQAAAIRAQTQPDDFIYVWGWSPGTYRYAYRRCPSRFATIEHVSHVYPYANFIVEGAERDLQAHPPAVIVMSITDYPALVTPPLRPFAIWFEQNYALRETIEGMSLFFRTSFDHGADAGG